MWRLVAGFSNNINTEDETMKMQRITQTWSAAFIHHIPYERSYHATRR